MAKIIAEFCQNHNGDRKILGEMIHAAAENGADYAKIQSIWVRDLTRRERFEQGETAPDGTVKIIKRPYQPEYDRLKTLELTLQDHAWFIEQCVKRGITPMTTVFTRGSVPEIAALPWPQNCVKVASYDCGSYPLLRDLKKNFKTIFISTGATEDSEIEGAAIELAGVRFVFFHCVTIYPLPLSQCHLARLEYLRQFSPEVGWSDHTHVATTGLKATKAALAMGADFVERHFTILPADKTKDGPVSIRPEHLKELAAFAKLEKEEKLREAKREVPEFDMLIGRARRPLSDQERLNRDYYRGRFATINGSGPVYNWEDKK